MLRYTPNKRWNGVFGHDALIEVDDAKASIVSQLDCCCELNSLLKHAFLLNRLYYFGVADDLLLDLMLAIELPQLVDGDQAVRVAPFKESQSLWHRLGCPFHHHPVLSEKLHLLRAELFSAVNEVLAEDGFDQSTLFAP